MSIVKIVNDFTSNAGKTFLGTLNDYVDAVTTLGGMLAPIGMNDTNELLASRAKTKAGYAGNIAGYLALATLTIATIYGTADSLH